MEQRLIDANALLDTTEHLAQVCFGQGQCYCERTKFQQLIKKQTTVDAVHVVRCGECKHLTEITDYNGWCTRINDHIENFDWFCADGERKEKADE